MKFNCIKQEADMTVDDRRLMVETLAEMRELKGEMKEFKDHVIGRVERLEKKEAERSRERLGIFSAVIALLALVINVLLSIFRHGGGK